MEIWTSFMNKLDYIKPDLSPVPHPDLKNLQDPMFFSFCSKSDNNKGVKNFILLLEYHPAALTKVCIIM